MLVQVDSKAPNIMSRSRRLVNVVTGFRLVDCLFPIATGQRELVIGDRQTGKTTLSVSAILAQISTNNESSSRKKMKAVYVCTSQKCSTVMRLYELFRRNKVSSSITIIFASVTEQMSLQYISPLAGTALAEFYRNTGYHCFIVYDDLSKHAISYRQLSLALRKPAGREAFPSDIFFLHSRLLERSCCLTSSRGSGTLTCLPIIETLGNDLSAYVATNVVSITDGQLYLDTILFGTGIFPAVSTEKSVSRVGAKSLDIFWRSISFRIYSLMNDYKQELDSVVKSGLFKLRKHRWERIHMIFQQRSPSYHFHSVLMLLSSLHGSLDLISVKYLRLYEYTLISRDVTILYGTSITEWMYSFNWLTYYILRLSGTTSNIMKVVWQYIWTFSIIFRLLILRRITKISRLTNKYTNYILSSTEYMSTTTWRDNYWRIREPLTAFTSLNIQHTRNITLLSGSTTLSSQWNYIKSGNYKLESIYW